jgi:hypothetical protein
MQRASKLREPNKTSDRINRIDMIEMKEKAIAA